MICQCGCGNKTRGSSKFIHGHNPPWNKGKSGYKIGSYTLTDEFRNKLSVSMKEKRTNDPRFAEGAKKGAITSGKQLSSWLHEKWQNPEYCKMMSEKHQLKANKQWQNPEFIAKQQIASHCHPNKQELMLLENLKPFGFQYVGDFKLMVGTKNPDYWDGSTKLIELFGDHFHRDEDSQIRIDFFKQYGYDCLVIWSSEIRTKKGMLSAMDKVSHFVKEV